MFVVLQVPKSKEFYVKLHRNLVEGIIEVMQAVFQDGLYSDRALEKVFRHNPRWGARDRAFVATHSYETLRWHKRLRYALGFAVQEAEQAQHTDILRRLVGAHLLLRYGNLPGWELFRDLPSLQQISHRYEHPQHPAVLHAVSDWLWHHGYSQMGEQWAKELQAMNRQAPVFIRVNTLKTNRYALIAALHQEGVTAYPVVGADTGLCLDVRTNIFRTKSFREGFFEVQDAGSQQIAPFLEVEPGMRVIDACAGGGGKTLHLAALMQGKGHIIAMDIEAWKLQELRRRARRNGAHNIETRLICPRTIRRLRQSADRLLLDVPCTGSGVLKRNPDAKWRITPALLADVLTKQQHILQHYSSMLRTGGKLVYSTCSLFVQENQEQIRTFLSKNSQFELEAETLLLPSQHGWDGFYMARLRRK